MSFELDAQLFAIQDSRLVDLLSGKQVNIKSNPFPDTWMEAPPTSALAADMKVGGIASRRVASSAELLPLLDAAWQCGGREGPEDVSGVNDESHRLLVLQLTRTVMITGTTK